MYELEKEQEYLLLIKVVKAVDSEDFTELEMLAETSGATVVGYMTQNLERAHPTHYFGTGKLQELKNLANFVGATGILCDDELSATQMKTLYKALNLKILDRTMIILDIFAERAISAEGKMQVELAQLRYRMSKLAGLGLQLSRQGGGIGTRGPGEKKLETDRRHIQRRLTQLSAELKEITVNRSILRAKRLQNNVPVIALIGYTNAGKSTLMNTLTNANVLAENKLFATLDTTTRKIELPGGTNALLSDTVGFIDKLPHNLIQAFRATLEELQYAAILLHVVDLANPNYRSQMQVVNSTLKDLKCFDKPIITAFNKVDAVTEDVILPAETAYNLAISAKSGENMAKLAAACEQVIKSVRKKAIFLIPYNKGEIVHLIHQRCEITAESFEENGTKISAYATEEMCGRLLQYVVG
ncbi:MAG: GTPase HflX [Defluviitaleaceae bacterium]|nr:GTPase HflX [Defluviitaleaceae bacterium]